MPCNPGAAVCGPVAAPVERLVGAGDQTHASRSAAVATSQPWPLPDLVVGSPTVTDSTLTSGQSFQLSLGYRSQPGLGPWAAATTLRYYGSTTSTIARREEQQPSDPRIGKPAASFGR